MTFFYQVDTPVNNQTRAFGRDEDKDEERRQAGESIRYRPHDTQAKRRRYLELMLEQLPLYAPGMIPDCIPSTAEIGRQTVGSFNKDVDAATIKVALDRSLKRDVDVTKMVNEICLEFHDTLDNMAEQFLLTDQKHYGKNSVSTNVCETLMNPKHWSTAQVKDPQLSSEIELSLPHFYSMFALPRTSIDTLTCPYGCQAPANRKEPEPLGEDDEWCICGVVGEGDPTMKYVQCSDPMCATSYFHRACVGIGKRAPKKWMCDVCAKLAHTRPIWNDQPPPKPKGKGKKRRKTQAKVRTAHPSPPPPLPPTPTPPYTVYSSTPTSTTRRSSAGTLSTRRLSDQLSSNGRPSYVAAGGM